MVTLFVVGAYRGEWRYFGLMDGVVFGKGVLAGTAALIVTIVYLYHFQNYSRVVFVNYASLLMLMLCGSRASVPFLGGFSVVAGRGGRRGLPRRGGGGGSGAFCSFPSPRRGFSVWFVRRRCGRGCGSRSMGCLVWQGRWAG